MGVSPHYVGILFHFLQTSFSSRFKHLGQDLMWTATFLGVVVQNKPEAAFGIIDEKLREHSEF